ncbi:MAG: alpha-mannosidase [Clostridia bacterium]|nr:alpha-mannosidase [Clostridia bacterium]
MNKEIHLIGNAHLDPTWLWRWQEGCGEVLQTFRSAVARLEEYDDFIFTCSSACYYKWVEDIDPELFKKIQDLVKRGKWVPVNGWWVQPDCNMPNSESFARQALYSQLYYYEKFGRICKTGYNVDSFGHSGMLPQLLTKGGMKCYVMMRPNIRENPDIPEGLFWWNSADGSKVLTYRIPESYAVNGKKSIDESIDRLTDMAEKSNHGMMLFYGVGNHGGGPTKGDIEYIKKLKSDGKNLVFSSPDKFFAEQCKLILDLPSWSDDLQHHASGCYSATSLIKQLNRKAEVALTNAEKWNTVAESAYGLGASTANFKNAWLNVCYNQFHDILCGCSIKEAYDDAREQMGLALDIAAKEENKALLRIAAGIDTWIDGVSDTVFMTERHHCRNLKYPRPVAVFNPLSFPVKTCVRTYHPSKAVYDDKGRAVVFSNVRSSRSNDSHKDTVFQADIPALGYAVYHLVFDDSDIDVTLADSDVSAGEYYLENSKLKVRFDKSTGAVSSLITKQDNAEHICPGSFVPTVIDNSKPDTWAHNIFKFHDVIGTMKLESIKLIEASGARAVIRTKHTYGKSYLSQDFILGTESESVRVKTRILWQEPLTILKMPVTIPGSNPVSTYEIPGGFIKRPCNGEEEPALTWGDITAEGKGVALISNAKYSYDCPDNTLRLTMLRNSIFADHYSDRPEADFEYCDEGLQNFEYAIYPHSGNAETSDVQKEADILNNQPVTVPLGYHKGSGQQRKSFITVEKENIKLTAFKKCEDASGDYIIRLAETQGVPCKTAVMCDIINAGFFADFGPLEIKTFRVDSGGYVTETDFLEGIVSD